MRRDDGQILPGLVILLLAIVGLGVLGFQIGKAAILRSQAQTAADAAALAGAREIKRQLEVQWATYGTTDISAIDRAAVVARMADYARENRARLDPEHAPEINGADVKAWVETEQDLGKDAAEVDRDQTRGDARARARVSLGVASYSAGVGSPVPVGVTPRISDEEWDEFAKKVSVPPVCEDVVTLGLFLKSHGFFVWQNGDPRLGGDPGHSYNPSSWHLKCGGKGALDVNFGPACGDLCPTETRAIDPLIGPLQKLGYFTIWRAPDHYDHLHVDPSRSGIVGAGGATGGYTGAIDDVGLDVKLVDWEAPIEPLFVGGQKSGFFAGPPDMGIVAVICRMAKPYGPKTMLAAFETAIVESGIHNLPYGSENSHGVFQQQWTVAAWGTLADTMEPPTATRMFLEAAERVDRRYPNLSAGQLSAMVQNPRADLRGEYQKREAQASALIREHC
jgi:hypothetical protein